MNTNQTTETELRHAVIDRLIAASLRDATPAREATLERWRAQAIEKSIARQSSQAA
ncbi:MAG: hypothetical protein P4L54_10755 [Acidocella sp.]|nr:hypothetical protein [Acidocella sp.]